MRLRALLFDLGDTLMDEQTEEKDADGVTRRADLLPGAAETVRDLYARGYPLALVADTRTNTARNVLRQHDLCACFAALALSEMVGCEKPDRRIFAAALDDLGVTPAEHGRVVMVGNNLARDIRGANALGLLSVWIHTNTRYPLIVGADTDYPRYEITDIRDLLPLVTEIEGAMDV